MINYSMEEELSVLKQRIKEWEHSFRSREGRPPNKSDIDLTGSGVRGDYLRYNQLKQQRNVSQEINGETSGERVPEWKRLSTKGFSLERNRKLSAHGRSVGESEKSVDNLNSDIETSKDKCLAAPVRIDCSCTPMKRVMIQSETNSQRIPQHYSLVQKQKSRRLYRKSISSEWIDRHSAEFDEVISNPNPSTDSSSTTDLIRGPVESVLFTRLYQPDTAQQQEDTPLMCLGMEELIDKCSSQQQPDAPISSLITTRELDKNRNAEELRDNKVSDVIIAKEGCIDKAGVEAGDTGSECLEEIEQFNMEKFEDTLMDSEHEMDTVTEIIAPVASVSNEYRGRREGPLSTETCQTQSNCNTSQKRTIKSAVSSAKRTKLNTSLSDNFVRLDLRRKHYKAKGRGMSAKTYKRNMFKKKQLDNDRGGVPRGGMGRGTRCFKCGEVGHWARNCSQRVAESDLGKFAGEKCSFQDAGAEDEQEIFESPLPTLEEAALMAQGRTLSDIRETEGREDPTGIPIGTAVTLDKTVRAQEIEPLFPEGMPQCEMEDRLKTALSTLKHSGFREGQREAVIRILQGRSTIVLLGTGGGKSLCYQLPAMLYAQRQTCTVLVVSPLVSLMEDQCLHMPAAISAACLHTNQTPKQREKILQAMRENKFSVILLSPEMLASQEKGVNEALSLLPPIPFVCIDEVHCLSQWSHNFRPSYLRLCKVIRERFGVSCLLALTATATRKTVTDLVARLDITGEGGLIKGLILPSNLKLSVSRAPDRDQALVALLGSDRFRELGSIIVYCTRQKETERIAQLLRTCLSDPAGSLGGGKSSLSTVAECYHAGMTGHKRNQVQKGFMGGKLKIVVATLAFGMGLNKSDVRAIIHYNMPSSCENYVQEVGRAGRDGVTSFCHVFLEDQDADLCELRKHAFANGLDRQSLRDFVNAVFPSCKCEVSRECPGHKVGLCIDRSVMDFDIPEVSLGTLLCYCEEQGWLDLSRQQYDTCHVKCYGRERQLRKLAGKMPVVAAAIALHGSPESVSKGYVCASISAVSRRMGWEYATLKRELGSLAHNDRGTGGDQRSSVIIEMTDLSYMFQIYHRKDNKVEQIVEFLEAKIEETEVMSLSKLALFAEMLTTGSSTKNEVLFREKIRKYFEDDLVYSLPPSLTDVSIIPRLRQEIGAFIVTHSDSTFTGRAIARIFHGISSPKFPAHMWGSTPYWRKYMNAGFHIIRKMAEKELGNQ